MTTAMPGRTMDVIARCQNEFDVFRWQHGGVSVWPFLRMKIGHHLEQKKLSFGTDRVAGLSTRLRRIARASAAKQPACRIGGGNVVFFNDGSGYYRGRCGTIINKNYAGIEREMIDLGNANILKFDYAKSFYDEPGATSLEPYLDRQVIKSSLRTLRESESPLAGKDRDELELLFTYLSEIEADLQKVTADGLLKYIERWLYVRNVMMDLFRPLEKGSLCFTTTYYGFYGMAFVSAMKRLGHVTADVQHGLQGESHYAYAHWPSGANLSLEQLPHAYLLWTESDVDNIEKWAHGQAAYRVGAPVTDTRSEKLRDIVTVRKNAGDTIFLYSCSPLSTEKQIGFLKQLADLDIDNAFFIVRAHPTEIEYTDRIKDYAESINLKSFEVFEASNSGLSDTIMHSDANITICSSTAIECNQFCIPSILSSQYSLDTLDAYDIGLFNYVENPAELEAAVKNIIMQNKAAKTQLFSGQGELISRAITGMANFKNELGLPRFSKHNLQ